MKVKKTLHAFGCALAIASFSVAAQIPVSDVVSITTQVQNQVQTMAQWAQQFQQMRAQIELTQTQMKSVTGSRGKGQLFDNPLVSPQLPADWVAVVESVKAGKAYETERSKYQVFPDRPKRNALNDTIAAQNVTMSDLYSRSNDRMGQVRNLMQEIDQAEDPAAKTDLTNRLINEHNAMQADQNLVTVLQSKQRQELEDARREAMEEYRCKEFKRSGC